MENKKNKVGREKGCIPWNKGLRGNEYLKHYKNNSTWLMKNKDDKINKKQSETLKNLYSEGKIIPFNKGKHFSEEHKRKLSETRKRLFKEGKLTANFKGKHHTEETKQKLRELNLGKVGYNKGKIFSEESRKKMSIAKKGIKLSEEHRKKLSEIRKKLFLEGKLPKNVGALGKDNPSWLGGKSFEPYDINWNERFKRAIRQRDNQICMNCGIHREKLKKSLFVHHINYDKELTIKENCISLCHICHNLTNANREYWTKLFQEKLSRLYNYKYLNGEIILKI